MDGRLAVREFVIGLLEMKGERSDVTDDEALVSAGLLDSLDVMNTVAFLEERFGVDFSKRPFDPDDFDSIDGISGLIE